MPILTGILDAEDRVRLAEKMKPFKPRSRATVDAEVRHWTENVSEPALLHVVAALQQRLPRIDRRHDSPYLAGYSRDGRTVYIDRHMPKSFVCRGRRVLTDRFLLTHEIVEKALLDQLRPHYLHAHQVALRIEQAAVRAAGVEWRDYNRFTKENEKEIGSERLRRAPRELDLTPYRDEEDFAQLQAIAVVD
jgi:hypothetical protein